MSTATHCYYYPLSLGDVVPHPSSSCLLCIISWNYCKLQFGSVGLHWSLEILPARGPWFSLCGCDLWVSHDSLDTVQGLLRLFGGKASLWKWGTLCIYIHDTQETMQTVPGGVRTPWRPWVNAWVPSGCWHYRKWQVPLARLKTSHFLFLPLFLFSFLVLNLETAPPGAGTFAYTVKMYSIFNAKLDRCQPPPPPHPEASSFEFKGVDEWQQDSVLLLTGLWQIIGCHQTYSISCSLPGIPPTCLMAISPS